MRQLGRMVCLALAAVGVTAAMHAQAGATTGKAPKPTAAAAAKPVSAPKIEVNLETKDVGTVAKGQIIDATFTIRNTGGSDLIISDARPGCGCTVASFDKVVKPGEEGKIVSHVDTKSFSGPITWSVATTTGGPRR